MTRMSADVKRTTGDGGKAAAGPLSSEELRKMDAYWRAANYLSVGQIYLLDNPLLKEPLQRKHVKPRLLGHWGTTPGLNFLYVHLRACARTPRLVLVFRTLRRVLAQALNRVIRRDDLNMMYIIGPGHGGPALVAQAWLEGTYSEVYPNIGPDEEGMKRLFKQFSFPGGIPSHVAPETPGSIHEGGGFRGESAEGAGVPAGVGVPGGPGGDHGSGGASEPLTAAEVNRAWDASASWARSDGERTMPGGVRVECPLSSAHLAPDGWAAAFGSIRLLSRMALT